MSSAQSIVLRRLGGQPLNVELDITATCADLKHSLKDQLGVHQFEVEILNGNERVNDDALQSSLIEAGQLTVTTNAFLAQHVIDQLVERMRSVGIEFGPGLSDKEIERVESDCSIRFPPDLKSFLQTAVPMGNSFTDWRAITDEMDFNARFVEGVLFDVECNSFWCNGWGERPESMTERLALAREGMSTAPRLIPIFSHRCMASIPFQAGQPVLSIHQTDVINYGTDLASYFAAEFRFKPVRNKLASPLAPIPFWSELPEMADECSRKKLDEDMKPVRVELFGSPDQICFDRNVALAGVSKNWLLLQYVSDDLKADHEVVYAAVAQSGAALKFAAPSIRADREFAIRVVAVHGDAFEFFDDALRKDRNIALLAAQCKDSYCIVSVHLRALGLEFTNDRELILAALRATDDSGPMATAGDELRTDRGFVMQAVQLRGGALSHASVAFHADKDVVLAAVGQNGRAVMYASEALQDDIDVALAAVSQNADAIAFLTSSMQSERRVIRAAMRYEAESGTWYLPEDFEAPSELEAEIRQELEA